MQGLQSIEDTFATSRLLVAANQLEDLFYICPDARQVYAAKNRRIIFRFLGTLFSV